MSVPNVNIRKVDFQTGSTAPSPSGICAVIGGAQAGPLNTPQSFSRDGDAFAVFGPAPMVEALSEIIAEPGSSPPIAIRASASAAAAYEAIDVTGMTGTSVPTAGAAVPTDNYPVIITFVKGGTIGAAGIQYTFSLDGGNSTSAPTALPTGAAPITLTVPNFSRGGSPGVSFSLAAGTVVAGDFFRCLTKQAKINDVDLAAALESLRTTTLGYEAILIDEEAGTGTTGLVDAWLAARETEGKFKLAFLNTRLKNQKYVGDGTVETEAAYATAMTTLTNQQSPSIRLSQATDGAAVTSTLTGLHLPRPAAFKVAAKTLPLQLGVEPAYVALGSLLDAIIVDSQGNPAYHNEAFFPNLDQLLLTTLRSLDGETGVFITNGRIFSQVGSDFVLIPQARTMNRACELSFQILQKQLSRGVGKKPKDPKTGKVYILETDALSIDGLVNPVIQDALKNQVQAVQFTLARDDDLSNQAGFIAHAAIAVVSLAYIKGFAVLAGFVRSIAVAA